MAGELELDKMLRHLAPRLDDVLYEFVVVSLAQMRSGP